MHLVNKTMTTTRMRIPVSVQVHLVVQGLGLGFTKASWTTRTRIHRGRLGRQRTGMSRIRRRPQGGALSARLGVGVGVGAGVGAEMGAGYMRRRYGGVLFLCSLPSRLGTLLNTCAIDVDVWISHSN